MNIPISISGIDYLVDDNFLNRLKVTKETKIGDTYFVTCDDNTVFSISNYYYHIFKINNKIDNILN